MKAPPEAQLIVEVTVKKVWEEPDDTYRVRHCSEELHSSKSVISVETGDDVPSFLGRLATMIAGAVKFFPSPPVPENLREMLRASAAKPGTHSDLDQHPSDCGCPLCTPGRG